MYVDLVPSSGKALAQCLAAYSNCLWHGRRLRVQVAKPRHTAKLAAERAAEAEAAAAARAEAAADRGPPTKEDLNREPLRIRGRDVATYVQVAACQGEGRHKAFFPPKRPRPAAELAWALPDRPTPEQRHRARFAGRLKPPGPKGPTLAEWRESLKFQEVAAVGEGGAAEGAPSGSGSSSSSSSSLPADRRPPPPEDEEEDASEEGDPAPSSSGSSGILRPSDSEAEASGLSSSFERELDAPPGDLSDDGTSSSSERSGAEGSGEEESEEGSEGEGGGFRREERLEVVVEGWKMNRDALDRDWKRKRRDALRAQRKRKLD